MLVLQDVIRHAKPCILPNVQGIVNLQQQRPSWSDNRTDRQILKGDHQKTILAKLGSNWASSFRGKKKFHPSFSIFSNSSLEVWIVGHNFERGSSKDCLRKVQLLLAQQFPRLRFFKFQPFFYFYQQLPCWLEVGTGGPNFGRGSQMDHSTEALS